MTTMVLDSNTVDDDDDLAGRVTVTCWERPPVGKALQGEAFPSVSGRVAWLAGWSVSWEGKQDGAGVSKFSSGEKEEEQASIVWKCWI